jgi:hypothetical protein
MTRDSRLGPAIPSSFSRPNFGYVWLRNARRRLDKRFVDLRIFRLRARQSSAQQIRRSFTPPLNDSTMASAGDVRRTDFCTCTLQMSTHLTHRHSWLLASLQALMIMATPTRVGAFTTCARLRARSTCSEPDIRSTAVPAVGQPLQLVNVRFSASPIFFSHCPNGGTARGELLL